jgi:hypothetical protein
MPHSIFRWWQFNKTGQNKFTGSTEYNVFAEYSYFLAGFITQVRWACMQQLKSAG